MKKLFLAATFAIAGITAANAQEATTAGQENNTTTQTQQTEQTANTQATAATDSVSKTAIKLEELPAPVQEALKGDPYKAWTPTAAFMVKDAQGKEWYQVDVKREQETGSVKFDKDGKPVE